MPEGTPASLPGQSQQPPMGSTPATAPSPNRGHEAAGMQKLGVALQTLQQALPLLQTNSEQWKAVNKMVDQLAKFVPPGSVSPAGNQNQLQQMAMKQQQDNQQMQMLKQKQQGAQPQAQPQPAAA